MKDMINAFVLGTMSPEERAAMAEARRHDVDLDRAICEAEDQLAPLSLAAGELPAPGGLWDRIEAALDLETEAMSGRSLESLSEGSWQAMCDGIEFKPMWNDRTRILRCKPGAEMPSHGHDDVEHLVVLSGDLIIGGRTFLPGDYVRSPRGDDGWLHTTRNGCLLFWQLGG